MLCNVLLWLLPCHVPQVQPADSDYCDLLGQAVSVNDSNDLGVCNSMALYYVHALFLLRCEPLQPLCCTS